MHAQTSAYARSAASEHYYDPFAVNPIRRSALAALTSGAIIFGTPLLFGPDIGSLILLSVGWFAAATLVLSIPVLVIASIEALWHGGVRRMHPSIDELDLSPRVRNLLHRHGYRTIAGIERASDGALLLLSNFDARALHEVRRAVSLWSYARRQQEWEEARQREARQRAALARRPATARQWLSRAADIVRLGRRPRR